MAEDKDGRSKAIDMALGQIEKQFGKGSVMRMGDTGAVRNLEAISTRPLGTPPIPKATSKPREPVEMTSKLRTAPVSPKRITEPLPNCFSI